MVPVRDDVPPPLTALVRPHIDSYDYFLTTGIAEVLERIEPVHIVQGGHRLRVWIENARVEPPQKGPEDGEGCPEGRLFPRQCREQGSSYRGALLADVCRRLDDEPVERLPRRLGLIPVMVKSSICHLRNLSPAQLLAAGEEEHELGGYFVCNGAGPGPARRVPGIATEARHLPRFAAAYYPANTHSRLLSAGNEKIIRLVIANRRNYVLALRRSAFMKRGPEYTDLACLIRCVRPDQSSVTMRVHYLTNGKVSGVPHLLTFHIL